MKKLKKKGAGKERERKPLPPPKADPMAELKARLGRRNAHISGEADEAEQKNRKSTRRVTMKAATVLTKPPGGGDALAGLAAGLKKKDGDDGDDGDAGMKAAGGRLRTAATAPARPQAESDADKGEGGFSTKGMGSLNDILATKAPAKVADSDDSDDSGSDWD
jgi:hypothetical protein